MSPTPSVQQPALAAVHIRPHTETHPDSLALTPPAGDLGDIRAAVAWAAASGADFPVPGRGDTARRWEMLATAGAHDLTLARVLEPHVDALAILDEAVLPHAAQGSTWGVYAAEGPAAGVTARRDGAVWRLSGTKPWCSLAGDVDHALITAWVDDEQRRLFAVDLRHDGVTRPPGPWHARGLADVVSTAVELDGVEATPVGAAGWYLERPGFAWGGMGVAAVWFGGAVGLYRQLHEQARRREPDQIALMHLGGLDADLEATRALLHDAATQVDAGTATGEVGQLLAARVRSSVFATAERALQASAHSLGPGPLVGDESHARRTADLHLYVRQHHAERSDAALGLLLTGAASTR